MSSQVQRALRWQAPGGQWSDVPLHPTGTIRVSIQTGPMMGFHTAGPGRAFVQQAYVGLSYEYGEPQPGPQSAVPHGTLSRRAPTGTSVGGPSVTSSRFRTCG